MCVDEIKMTKLSENCAQRSEDVVASVHCEIPQKLSLTFVSWSVTQAYMSSLTFTLCFCHPLVHSFSFPLRVPILIAVML